MDISDCSKDLTFFNCFPVGLTNDSVLFKKRELSISSHGRTQENLLWFTAKTSTTFFLTLLRFLQNLAHHLLPNLSVMTPRGKLQQFTLSNIMGRFAVKWKATCLLFVRTHSTSAVYHQTIIWKPRYGYVIKPDNGISSLRQKCCNFPKDTTLEETRHN